MWVQTGGPPDKPVVLFDYSTSRVHDVATRLLEGCRGYVMTGDYAGYNVWARSPVLSVWGIGLMHVVSSSKLKRCSPKTRQGVLISR